LIRICKLCRRINPSEAAYCYHDGSPLEFNRSGAVDVGTLPFSFPFVFPSGRSCENFNQLSRACHENPAGALDVLRRGYLESFLAGQGRADLSHAAHLAARAADRERGLDEFLGRLPGAALTPARLRVEPELIDLGTLRPGEDRHCDLTLHNEGSRLLYGSASCDDVSWLSLADNRESQRKVFQFSDRTVLPLRILGRALRALNKPQEAKVQLESNGGNRTVVVRIQVSVRPFPEGMLAGALSPRQLAEKARDAPKEAAILIENGAVARWYQTNGWTYPVTGPSASGTAAVQQLFEALGLAKPPRVELGEDAVVINGQPGETVEYVIAVVAQENRAALAFGKSDQPWLRVGPSVFRGRSAFVPLQVAGVPGRPGETLQAKVSIKANGKQRFVVPVTLVVGARPPAAERLPAPDPPRPAPDPARAAAAASGSERVLRTPSPQRAGREGWGWKTFLPAVLLIVLLFGVVLRDYLAPAAGSVRQSEAIDDPVPRIDLRLYDTKIDDDLQRLWLLDPQPSMRFGLVMLHNGMEIGKGITLKRLTFDPWGRTNNLCLRFDKKDERLFGSARGRWENREAKNWKDENGKEHDGVRSVWLCDQYNIEITQFVERVRGEQSRLLDTCRVRYQIENRGPKAHTVGLRFLLDTYIGGNDGVPFTIPGDNDLCDTLKDLPGQAKDKKMPDFLQALEKPDLANPRTVAHIRLKLPDVKEVPQRVTLGAWPNEKLRVLHRKALGPSTLWEVPLLTMKSLGLNDSAVALYWKEEMLKPREKREVGFEYGLWNLASQGSRLALTVDGVFRPDGELTIVAYVNAGGLGGKEESVRLTLPDGFQLLSGDNPQRILPLARAAKSGNRPITWKVRAGPTGRYKLVVETSSGLSQSVPVEIKSAIFD
jgi:hypothetical protein